MVVKGLGMTDSSSGSNNWGTIMGDAMRIADIHTGFNTILFNEVNTRDSKFFSSNTNGHSRILFLSYSATSTRPCEG